MTTTLDEDVGRGSSEEELVAHRNAWKSGQQWEFRRLGERQWRTFPVCNTAPGWFYDTEYRQRPEHST